jgi:hypothetical protein
MPNTTSANWITELIAAAAWPAVAVAMIYWFRTPIRAAIETLGPRVNRVSVAGISIEL